MTSDPSARSFTVSSEPFSQVPIYRLYCEWEEHGWRWQIRIGSANVLRASGYQTKVDGDKKPVAVWHAWNKEYGGSPDDVRQALQTAERWIKRQMKAASDKKRRGV